MAELYIPNMLNTLAQADAMAAQTNDRRRQNALADFYAQNGAGLMSGDQNAMNRLAGFDPMAALDIQGRHQQAKARDLDMEAARLGMDNTRHMMGVRQSAEDRDAKSWEIDTKTKLDAMSAAEVAAQREQFRRGEPISTAKGVWQNFTGATPAQVERARAAQKNELADVLTRPNPLATLNALEAARSAHPILPNAGQGVTNALATFGMSSLPAAVPEVRNRLLGP